MLSLERWNVDQVLVFDVGNGALLPFGSSFLLFLLLRAFFFIFFDFFISVVLFVFFFFVVCIFVVLFVFFFVCIFFNFVGFFLFFNDLFFLFDLFLVFLIITSGCSVFCGRMGAELRGP
ncbi:hypothetical protein PF010_g33252 [Phytophthora fragariae]|uniref:Uncharacterized protein n=1 Tax=Phytophthora fragariae TaxID=53985 RepID=A0A6G0PZL6_9STRA|nr:hypothetical protein PF003_g25253 [Phytophthora fragariae]KAE9044108.1 hypothetical protein PF010_g33252 [Phytophthora fragariae]KAE9261889.1 hypothetical protein PF008_g32741 [Phytophthora fragariae]